jgi:hypothetical protein
MKITLAGSMIFLDRMNDIKTQLEGFGHSAHAPAFTEEELKTGSNTFMDYIKVQGGVEKVLPDNDIWKIKEQGMMEYKKYIDETDVLLVCNFDKGEKKNRIGDNTIYGNGVCIFYWKENLCVARSTIR